MMLFWEHYPKAYFLWYGSCACDVNSFPDLLPVCHFIDDAGCVRQKKGHYTIYRQRKAKIRLHTRALGANHSCSLQNKYILYTYRVIENTLIRLCM